MRSEIWRLFRAFWTSFTIVSSIASTVISSPWKATVRVEAALLAVLAVLIFLAPIYEGYLPRGFCFRPIYIGARLVDTIVSVMPSDESADASERPGAKTSSAKASDVSGDPRWGFSPISRRYVLRTGSVWKRLVKSGAVHDPEVAEQLATPSITKAWRAAREPPGNNVALEEGPPEKQVTRAEVTNARRSAKKLIAEHVDQLEGLPPDQVDAMLRRLLARPRRGDRQMLAGRNHLSLPSRGRPATFRPK